MTIKQAVEILNRERHRGHDNWRSAHFRTPAMFTTFPVYCAIRADGPHLVDSTGSEFYLIEFEAVATAEKSPPNIAVVGTVSSPVISWRRVILSKSWKKKSLSFPVRILGI